MTTSPHVIAIDCDLHRIHAYSTEHGRLAYNSPDGQEIVDFIRSEDPDTVLFECGSFVSYRRAHLGLIAWYIFNSYHMRRFYELRRDLLVSPSSTWTRGFEEKVRHHMAGVTGQDNHDIRECRAMIAFFEMDPSLWVTVPEYLQSLTLK